MSQDGLPRLTITAYADEDRLRRSGLAWNVPFKADSLNLNFNNDYAADQSLGAPAGGLSFQGGGSAELSVTLFLYEDVYTNPLSFALGTGDVAGQINRLYKMLYNIDGSSHQPPFLTLSLSKDIPFPYGRKAMPAVLRSMKLQTTPLNGKNRLQRAEVACVFALNASRKDRMKAAKLNSPDLTHYRQVIAGDRLDHKTWQIYGNPALAPQVARGNDLDSPRLLAPGQTLMFAPYQTPGDAP